MGMVKAEERLGYMHGEKNTNYANKELVGRVEG